MADMVETEVDVLHGQVVNEDTEMPIGTDEEVGVEADQGDEESNPDG
jgi:hypothetical protein